MRVKRPPVKYLFIFAVIITVSVSIGYFWYQDISTLISKYYHLFTDKSRIQTFITSFGIFAPFVFIFLQILQVLLAPIPGEASGIIGGFLFGITKGFFYSTIGLSLGSWVNFMIGRFMGKRFIRQMIPSDYLNRFDAIIKQQGIVVVFIFFLFPGFPKDYLCLFLGLSTMPIRIFMILAVVGRMPGTFMLSLQGVALYEQDYQLLGIMMAINLVLVFIVYRNREKIYEKMAAYNDEKPEDHTTIPK